MMNAITTNLESLAGRPGMIMVAVKPAPCRGPLTAAVLTRPAALCLQQRGVNVGAGGGYVQRGVLFCQFKAADLGAALPAVRAYFDEIGFQNVAQLACQPAGELETYDFEPKQHRSFSSLVRWTWRDELGARWDKLKTSPRVSRVKAWWFNRQLRGDIAAAFVVLAVAAGLLAWLGAFHNWPVVVVTATVLSGLAFASAIVTRPMIPLDEAERLIARAIRDGQDERKEFIARLKGESRADSEGDHRG